MRISDFANQNECEYAKYKKYLKTLNDDVDCLACGITLSKEDMKEHDDIDCFDYLEMMRKYNYILG